MDKPIRFEDHFHIP